ncbi:hypothetical protein EDD15DRAFT_2195363 [Pisolithus albus]|nr:hypothetical protein EDD15DRAFT_2195363 [Pisolithus albus]
MIGSAPITPAQDLGWPAARHFTSNWCMLTASYFVVCDEGGMRCHTTLASALVGLPSPFYEWLTTVSNRGVVLSSDSKLSCCPQIPQFLSIDPTSDTEELHTYGHQHNIAPIFQSRPSSVTVLSQGQQNGRYNKSVARCAELLSDTDKCYD